MLLPGLPRWSQLNWQAGQMQDLRNIWDDINRALNFNASLQSGVIVAPYASITTYPPAVLNTGTLFWASDRTVMYMVQSIAGTNTWVYVLGEMRGTLSPNLKPALGLNDAGFLFTATDFDRKYRWSGVAWADAPGEPPRDFVSMFRVAPGTGWQLCDGSAGILISTSTGGTSAITVPTLNAATFMRGNAAYSGPVATAAVAPTTNSHSHAIDPPSTTSGTPSATQMAPVTAQNITGASNATPIVITAESDHNMATGDLVVIAGVLGNTAANGGWTITVISATTFSLDTSVGNGAYTAGSGTALRSLPSRTHTHATDISSFTSGSTTVTANADGTPKLMDFLAFLRL